jgi:hypothetical protein
MLRTRDTIPRSVYPVSVNNLGCVQKLAVYNNISRSYKNSSSCIKRIKSSLNSLQTKHSILNSPWRERRNIFINDILFRQ